MPSASAIWPRFGRAADDDDRDIFAAQVLDEHPVDHRASVEDGHLDVGQDQLRKAIVERPQTLDAVARGANLVPLDREQVRHRLAHVVVVVDEDEARHGT